MRSALLAFVAVAFVGQGVCAAQGDLREVVDRSIPNLSSEDPDVARQARKDLLAPLEGDTVSVRTRLAYSSILQSHLVALADDEDETLAVNAMLIAGEVATADSVTLLTEHLADERPGMRFAAAGGFKRMFDAIGRSQPAINPAAIARVIESLEAAAKTETDPLVLDAIMQALGRALGIPDRAAPGARSDAVDAILASIKPRLADPTKVDDAMRPAIVRASQVVRAVFIDQRPLTDEQVRGCAELAGDTLRHLTWRLGDRPVDQEGRRELAAMARAGESLYSFVHRRLGAAPLELKLGEKVADAQDASFKRNVDRLIGADGVMSAPPFGFPDDRFAIPE